MTEIDSIPLEIDDIGRFIDSMGDGYRHDIHQSSKRP